MSMRMRYCCKKIHYVSLLYTYTIMYMDKSTLPATIRDTPPLKAGTRKARSVSDCQLKRKESMVGSRGICLSTIVLCLYKTHADNTITWGTIARQAC